MHNVTHSLNRLERVTTDSHRLSIGCFITPDAHRDVIGPLDMSASLANYSNNRCTGVQVFLYFLCVMTCMLAGRFRLGNQKLNVAMLRFTASTCPLSCWGMLQCTIGMVGFIYFERYLGAI